MICAAQQPGGDSSKGGGQENIMVEIKGGIKVRKSTNVKYNTVSISR